MKLQKAVSLAGGVIIRLTCSAPVSDIAPNLHGHPARRFHTIPKRGRNIPKASQNVENDVKSVRKWCTNGFVFS